MDQTTSDTSRGTTGWLIALVAALAMYLSLATLVGECSKGGHRGMSGMPNVAGTIVLRDTVHDTTVVHPAPIVIRQAPVTVAADRAAVPVAWIDSSDTNSPPDTLGVLKPLRAELRDTVVDGDTITAAFTFPPPRLDIDVRRAPDSVITHTQTVTKEIYVEPSLFERVGWGAIGAAVGAVITLIIGSR